MADKKLGQRIAETESKSKKAAISRLDEIPDKLKSGKIQDMIEDLRAVQNYNERYITREFYLVNGKYSQWAIRDNFGTFAEFRRASGLDSHRGLRSIELNTATHSSRDRYRGFQEVELDPYIGKYERSDNCKKYKRMVIASDFHGLSLDKWLFNVFCETIERIKPDVVCLAGDVFDLYDFSRFDHDPRQSELSKEIIFVRDEIFKNIRKSAGSCCQIDLVIGNHEQRFLRHIADRSPYTKVLLDLMGHSLGNLLGLDKYEVNLVSRSDLSAFRSAEHKEQIKNNYKIYYDMFAVIHDKNIGKGKDFNLCGASGHTHKPNMEFSVDERFGSKWWMTLPCMANVDAEYVSGLNKYQQGFGIVHFDIENKACVGELIVANDSFCVVGGKVYER